MLSWQSSPKLHIKSLMLQAFLKGQDWPCTYLARGSLGSCFDYYAGQVLYLYVLVASDVVTQVGYWKDLLEILVKACVSAEELQMRKLLQGQTKDYMKWVGICIFILLSC